MSQSDAIVCPFCGAPQPRSNTCAGCGTPLDQTTLDRTLARMGPWFIRSATHPYMPGCSWEQIADFVAQKIITRDTILRGPTTSQLWMVARRTPGVAHLLGVCHSCRATVTPDMESCPACRASFGAPLDRNALGLPTKDEPPAAHLDETEAPRLSAFATNDELREGLHDEVRRRRTVGGSSAPAPTSSSGQAGPLPSDGSSPPGTAARRRVLPWWLFAGAGVVVVAAIVIAVMAPRTTRSNGADSGSVTTARNDARAAKPDSMTPEASGASSAPDPAPRSLEAGRTALNTSDPAQASAQADLPASAEPAADKSAAPPPDPLAPIEALLREARDPERSRAERRARVAQAMDALHTLATPGDSHGNGPGIDPARVASLRQRAEREAQRLVAEVFVFGEGSSP